MGKKGARQRKKAASSSSSSAAPSSSMTVDSNDSASLSTTSAAVEGGADDAGYDIDTPHLDESSLEANDHQSSVSSMEDTLQLVQTLIDDCEAKVRTADDVLGTFPDVQRLTPAEDQYYDSEDTMQLFPAHTTTSETIIGATAAAAEAIAPPRIKTYELDAADASQGHLSRYIAHERQQQHRHSLVPRSQVLESSGSASSLANAVASLPRTRSLLLPDNGAVLQAVPSTKAEVVEVVAEQSWLVTKLTVQLLWALRNSSKWTLCAVRLVWFVILLLPAFVAMVYYWVFNLHVHKNIVYGLQRRNLLDIYTVPSDKLLHNDSPLSPKTAAARRVAEHPRRPVVVFLTGGAWIIGYKAWGALMGKVLSSCGVVVVTPDYRNFPQGIVPDMVEDASTALQWIFDNIHHFGGDPDNVTLIGQSAGAHIGMCALLEQVERRKEWLHRCGYVPSSLTGAGESHAIQSPTLSTASGLSQASATSVDSLGQRPTWGLHQIRSFIGISGPYNIEVAIETFHRHGFDKNVVERIMAHRIAYFSPALRLFAYSEHAKADQLLENFPPVYLYHGTSDKTVSWQSTEQFTNALKSCGLPVQTKYFEGKSHTDPIIEDPMCGDDFLLEEVMGILQTRSPLDLHGRKTFQRPELQPQRALYPAMLVRLARKVNPF